MKSRALIYSVAIVVVLGALVAGDSLFKKQSKDSNLADLKLMTMDVEQVQSILFQRGSEIIKLKRSIQGWDIVEPRLLPADNVFISELLLQLKTESALEVAKEGSDIDWKIYGLEPSLASYQMFDSLGKSVLFQISSERNFEGYHFLRRDTESRVLVVASTWFDRAERSLNDFRERRLFTKKIAQIRKIELHNKYGDFVIENKDSVWFLSKKGLNFENSQFDQNKIRSFIKTFSEARYADYKAESAEEIKKAPLSQWGLGIPKVKMAIHLESDEGSKTWSLKVGQDENFKVYAYDETQNIIGIMESGAIDDVLRFTENEYKVETVDQKGRIGDK